MKTALALLAGMLFILGSDVPAQANLWRAADVTTAITVADAHWPGSPCQGREALTWVKGGEDYAEMLAWATPATCSVTIWWDLLYATNPKPSFLCTVLEHEFGHLAGLSHSTDPHDVMFPYTNHPMGDCLAALPNSPPKAKRRKAQRG